MSFLTECPVCKGNASDVIPDASAYISLRICRDCGVIWTPVAIKEKVEVKTDKPKIHRFSLLKKYIVTLIRENGIYTYSVSTTNPKVAAIAAMIECGDRFFIKETEYMTYDNCKSLRISSILNDLHDAAEEYSVAKMYDMTYDNCKSLRIDDILNNLHDAAEEYSVAKITQRNGHIFLEKEEYDGNQRLSSYTFTIESCVFE